MAELVIGIRYLTGYAVATESSSRDRAEWPPHPARVFMALAAAHFETGEDPEERVALKWLEGQQADERSGPPNLFASHCDERQPITNYVPVNDAVPSDLSRNKTLREIIETPLVEIDARRASKWVRAIDKAAKTAVVAPAACRIELLEKLKNRLERGNAPEIRAICSELLVKLRDTSLNDFATEAIDVFPAQRGKQPRTFPRARPHEETVYLVWPDVELDEHRAALECLCSKVTRIGHSSSLVQMWVADGVPDEAPPAWEPDDVEADVRLRVCGDGSLEYLERQYGQHERDAYHRLNERIGALEAEKKTIRGKGSQARKAGVQEQIDAFKKELPDQPPRDPLRPVMSLWQGYRRQRPKLDEAVPGTVWDPYLIVRRLEPMESRHRRLDLVSTLQVTAAMHKAVLSYAGESALEIISGHKPDGSPTDRPHLAYLPLAFVGREHATGHLMGLAIAVPGGLDRQQRQEALAAVGQVEELTIDRIGRWQLDRDTQGLKNLETIDWWTGGNDGATQWATVTPIAFDQHSKAKTRQEREEDLARIIKTGCSRIGGDSSAKHTPLPEPAHVILTPVSAHLGVPAAHEFPRLSRKDGSERRHAHAILIFDRPVRGPIAIGAGRYRGYGFCRPLRGGEMV